MLNARVATLALLGFLVMGVPEAKAKPPQTTVDVVMIDCHEEGDSFDVEDFSSTDDVGLFLGEDCAIALQRCLVDGYRIVPGGGGAIFDAEVNDEHMLYTLVRRGRPSSDCSLRASCGRHGAWAPCFPPSLP